MNKMKSTTAHTGNDHAAAVVQRLARLSRVARPFAQRERVIDISSCFTIGYVGDALGRPALRAELIANGVLTADGLPPEQSLIARERFAVIDNAGRLEVLVTPEGQSWLALNYPPAHRVRISGNHPVTVQ